jgi:uncharacterized membrane protein YfcA
MDLVLGRLNIYDILAILFAFAAGGFVKGIVGLGLPMIAVPIISTILDPRAAIAAMTLPILGSNFIQARTGGGLIEITLRFRSLLIPLTIGSVLGAALITSVRTQDAALILGGLVSAFALSTLFGWSPQIPARIDRRLRPAIGLLSGVIGGMSSFFAPTLTPYLFSLGLDKTTFIRVLGVAFLIGEFPLFFGLTLKGFAPWPVWALSAVGWAVVGAAMHLGGRLRDRVPQKHFKTLVGAMLLLIGLNMIRRVVF